MINSDIIGATSQTSGFKNYLKQPIAFSKSLSQTLSSPTGVAVLFTPGTVVRVSASAPLPSNIDSIGSVEVQYSGVESFYRLIPGVAQADYPNTGSRTYSIETMTYIKSGQIFVDSFIINQIGSNVSIPDITFNCIAKMYRVPF
jgi:hypothetical protein